MSEAGAGRRGAGQAAADSRLRLPAMGWPPALLFTVLLAALTLSAFAAGDGVLSLDVTVSRFVQRAPETGAGDVARLVNALGATPAMLAVGAVTVGALMATGRTGPALFLLAAVIARVANPALKAFFDSPRPMSDLVRVSEETSGLGFPSGHVMGVVLFYGALLLLVRDPLPRRRLRLAIQAGALGMILLSGFGRIYVGAHWPSDVIGGYLWGGVLLGALALGYRHGSIVFVRAAVGVLIGDRRTAIREGVTVASVSVTSRPAEVVRRRRHQGGSS